MSSNTAGIANLKTLNLTVNGKAVRVQVDLRETLLDVLRNHLQLTGTKQGCSVGECGACTVLVDGIPINSCIYLASWAEGKTVLTVEGLEREGVLSPVQLAFVEEGAIQCGFCTPGLVMSTTALRESGKDFTEDELRRELSGHLCRCTGYQKIYDAAEKALNK